MFFTDLQRFTHTSTIAGFELLKVLYMSEIQKKTDRNKISVSLSLTPALKTQSLRQGNHLKKAPH